MVIPKYIQEMMSRAAFDRVCLYGGDHGYTIKIRKASTQTYARMLDAECNRRVSEFADGKRLAFDGMTEAAAAMEAAQDQHGNIVWYDGVTDEHYESGMLHHLTSDPPFIDPDNMHD